MSTVATTSPVDTTGEAPVLNLGGVKIPCVTELAPGAMLSLAAGMERPDDGIQMAATMQRFLYACVAEGAERTLETVLFRKSNPVPMTEINDAMEALSEHYTARPTDTPNDSAGGPASTTPSSTGDSSSPDSNPSQPVVRKVVSMSKGTVQVEDGDDETSSTPAST